MRPRASYVNVYRSLQSAALILASLLYLFLFKIPDNPYVAFALTGSLAYFAGVHRDRRHRIATALAGLGYWAVYHAWGARVDPYPGWWIAYPGGLLGLAAVVITLMRWFWAAGDEASVKRELVLMTSIPVLCSLSTICVSSAIRLAPSTYDYTLYAIDRSLGSPSFHLARWFSAHSIPFAISAAVYNALPLWIAGTWIWLKTRAEPRYQDRAWAFLALGAVGFALYQLCPASGPINRFAGQFPWTEPAAAALPTGPAFLGYFAPRNAMPSLHIAWTLMVLFCTLERGWPLRIASALISALTLAMMLGSGEHWLIDAVVSVPLVTWVFALRARSISPRIRWTICFSAGTVTVAWLLALRTGAALLIPAPFQILAVSLTVLAGSIATPAVLGYWPRTLGADDPLDRVTERNRVMEVELAGNT